MYIRNIVSSMVEFYKETTSKALLAYYKSDPMNYALTTYDG